jgi:hypothetical protein
LILFVCDGVSMSASFAPWFEYFVDPTCDHWGGGGETSWQGTSWCYCLSSVWVWWNSLFRNFHSWHMVCLITSHCRHSWHCCLKLPEVHLPQYRTLIRMWVRCPHLSLVATRVLMPHHLIFLCVNLQLRFYSCFQTATDGQIGK